ncbi:MAG: hypothetical protein ABW040_08270 [Microbacteriaceae bacterium]
MSRRLSRRFLLSAGTAGAVLGVVAMIVAQVALEPNSVVSLVLTTLGGLLVGAGVGAVVVTVLAGRRSG